MKGRCQPTQRGSSVTGVFLLEIGLALVILGMITAAIFPLLQLAAQEESDQADRAALAQIRAALVAYAVRNGGFPSPLALHAETNSALSRTRLAAPNGDGTLRTVIPGENPFGAVPSHVLGTPRSSSRGTLFLYDVHPALRADLPFDLTDGFDATGQGLSALHGLTRNAQGTGGSIRQLCRNLNTLIDMERRLRENPATDGTHYRVSLPRTWQSHAAADFTWNGTLFAPTVDATVTPAWLLQRSSPAAFVVTRPHPLALARLDRANTVFAQDIPTDAQKQGAAKGYRIYEDPAAGAMDSASDDLRDYGGSAASLSLLELRNALQAAGQCTQLADTCLNTEIYATVNNDLAGQFHLISGDGQRTPSGSQVQLPLHWTVNASAHAGTVTFVGTPPAAEPVGKSATVTAGTSRGACVPALDASASFTSMPARTLNIFTALPDGRWWFIRSIPLRGNTGGALPSDDVLHSGRTQEVRVKCFGYAAIEYEYDTPPPQPTYRISTGATAPVSCVVTND